MRPLNVLVGAAAAGLSIYVAVESAPRRAIIEVLPDGGAMPDGGLVISTDAGMSNSASSGVGMSDGGSLPIDSGSDDLGFGGMAGAMALGDSGMIPMLAEGTPKGTRLGIVLIAYAGAETLPGQPSSKRSKADAKALADKLDEDAKSDFHGAVQRGDSGSGDDLGHFYRGDLDQATEYAIFSLPVGGVSAVIDTPRGFWIAKRIE